MSGALPTNQHVHVQLQKDDGQRSGLALAHLHEDLLVPVQAAALAHGMAGNRVDCAGCSDAPPGLARRLTMPLFATSSVTGSGIPLLHAFLSALRPGSPASAGALRQVCEHCCHLALTPLVIRFCWVMMHSTLLATASAI